MGSAMVENPLTQDALTAEKANPLLVAHANRPSDFGRAANWKYWKSAIRQVWKPALRLFSSPTRRVERLCQRRRARGDPCRNHARVCFRWGLLSPFQATRRLALSDIVCRRSAT